MHRRLTPSLLCCIVMAWATPLSAEQPAAGGGAKPDRDRITQVSVINALKREDLRGTFVGIRSPRWAHGITVPGYHWHFMAADRRSGGHVLDCHLRGGTISYDVCGSWLVKLEESADFNGVNLSADLREELDLIERTRGRPADVRPPASASPTKP
jgi:acetolactate decarboxylase